MTDQNFPDEQAVLVHKARDTEGTVRPACDLTIDRISGSMTFSQEWGGVTCPECLKVREGDLGALDQALAKTKTRARCPLCGLPTRSLDASQDATRTELIAAVAKAYHPEPDGEDIATAEIAVDTISEWIGAKLGQELERG